MYGTTLQPGGHLGPTDTTLVGAALRELSEETGIDPEVGRLQESEVTAAAWHPLNLAERLVGPRIARAVTTPTGMIR